MIRDHEREQKGRPLARGAEVTVKLKNGKTLKKTVDYFLGSYLRPMSDAQMAAKYRRLALRTLPADKVAEIEDIVWNLERAPDMTKLVAALQGTP